MEPLKAVVKNGRLVLDAPTDLPEGTEVELAVVEDADAELLDELEASEADEAAGELVDFDAVIGRLGSPEGQARLQTMAAAAGQQAKAILAGALLKHRSLRSA